MVFEAAGRLLREAFGEWRQDRVSELAAQLAFYASLSLAPLLVIATAVAGLALGARAARGEVVMAIQDVVGESAAQVIEQLIARASPNSSSVAATIASLATLIYAATGVFNNLKSSLDKIWPAEPGDEADEGITDAVRGALVGRGLAFLMVLGIGAVLVLSQAMRVALVLGLRLVAESPLRVSVGTYRAAHNVGAFIVVTLMFAFVYRLLPEVRLRWRDIWLGAAITSGLFLGGNLLIELYLSSEAAPAFGASGSLLLVLLWTYYSAQIFFFGAEITKVYTRWQKEKAEEQMADDMVRSLP